MAGGATVEALREKVAHLEELVGVATLDSSVTLANQLENVAGNIEGLA